MSNLVSMDAIYRRSDDVVARDISGELMIVPLVAGIGNMEDELYSMNASGRAIWDRLDGQVSLQQVSDVLAGEFGVPVAKMAHDVSGFVEELVSRGIVVHAGA